MAFKGSYVTAIRSSASVAISSLTAATAATGSPTKRTLSWASACSSWLTGRMPKGRGGPFPVSPASPPPRASALVVSTVTMRACACGLRSSLQYSMRGRNRSSANLVTPVTFAVASSLRWALPTTRSLAPAIHALVLRRRGLPPHPSGRQLDRLVDLDVAGAAAEVAGQRLLDLVARRRGVPREQRLGGEQERRRAVAALRRAQLGERFLQRVQASTRGHALDRFDAAARTGQAERETGEHRLVVQQHGAGAALAQLTPVFGAGKAAVLPQDLEQRLVRRERDLGQLTVQLERDGDLGIGHEWKPNLAGGGMRRQLSAPTQLRGRNDAGGRAVSRSGGRSGDVPSDRRTTRAPDRPGWSHQAPCCGRRLPRPRPRLAQDRAVDRRAQRHPRRDPRARRPRLGGFRRAAAEADDGPPQDPRGRNGRAVLGRLCAGDDDGLRAPPGRVRSRADRPDPSALRQVLAQHGDGVYRGGRAAQFRRGQVLLLDRHRRRPRDRELARRPADVLRPRRPLYHAHPLAQPRLGGGVDRHGAPRTLTVRQASGA